MEQPTTTTTKSSATIIDGTSYDNVIPICVAKDGYNVLRVGNIKYYRWQLPLIPAAALNTHKVQGLGAANDIVYEPTGNRTPWARL